MTEDRRPHVLELCYKHRHDLIVHKLHINPLGPWVRAELYCKLIMLRGIAVERPDIMPKLRSSSPPCLACVAHPIYMRAVTVLRKGIDHAGEVAAGKKADEGFLAIDNAQT